VNKGTQLARKKQDQRPAISQLRRNSIGIEIDPEYIKIINKRLESPRYADSVLRHREYYRFTKDIEEIWPVENALPSQNKLF
jgi:DNA modification methylase